MNEQELREMIRASIARHLGASAPPGSEPIAAPGHASHLRLPLVSGDEEGACLIEPAVRCNHCGYCLSLGH